jgi:signal transduction histidine kinase
MSSNGVVMLPEYAATHSASEFAGTQLSADVEASNAKRFGPSRVANLLRMMERVLVEGRRGVRRPGPAHQRFSLAQHLARVPSDSGQQPTEGFRVIVHGREKALNPKLRQEIYLIGREAIINACRHSGARTIEIRVEYQSAELRISVRDNGYGIDPRTLRWGQEENSGLQMMRERAERMGARLRLCSGVGLGTEVELCLPGGIAFRDAPL